MPLKVLHPKKSAKIKQKLIVIQGKCDNAQKITATLTNKTTGKPVTGQKLGTNAKQWGFLYKGLADGSYSFSISQTNSPVVMDAVDFDVAADGVPPPPPGTPPTITGPADGDEVAVTFYPYGTSTQTITTVAFSGNGQGPAGTVTQQPDSDGNWVGQVDGIDTWPNGAGSAYQLNVSNSSGTTTVNNLTISS